MENTTDGTEIIQEWLAVTPFSGEIQMRARAEMYISEREDNGRYYYTITETGELLHKLLKNGCARGLIQ